MQIQKYLPWRSYALGHQLFLFFLMLLFVIPTKGQPLLTQLSFYNTTIPFQSNSSFSSFNNFHNNTISFLLKAVCSNPTISTQPTNQNVCEGKATSFSVVAMGEVGSTLSYQWQENKYDGNGFTNVGTNNSTYSINTVAASQNNYTYQEIVTDDNGTPANFSDDCITTSTIATLTVIDMICDAAPWSGNN